MTRLLFNLAISCVTACFSSNAAPSSIPAGVTAESLLSQMRVAYESAKTYSDNGIFLLHANDLAEPLHFEFRTWFARPMHFRFETLEKISHGNFPEVRMAMWSDGRNHYNWDSRSNRVDNIPNVKQALWGFVSAAYVVPSLLEPSYGGPRRLSDLLSPVIVGEEIFEGTDCDCVQGVWPAAADKYKVWVGKSDHFVRKICQQYEATRWAEEIHRNIVVGAEIPDDVFHFVPPSPK